MVAELSADLLRRVANVEDSIARDAIDLTAPGRVGTLHWVSERETGIERLPNGDLTLYAEPRVVACAWHA